MPDFQLPMDFDTDPREFGSALHFLIYRLIYFTNHIPLFFTEIVG
jgi:hypothetical protein